MNAWAASRRPSCNLSAAVSCVFSECCNVSRLYRSHSSTHSAVPDTPVPHTRTMRSTCLPRTQTPTHRDPPEHHTRDTTSCCALHVVHDACTHTFHGSARRQHPRRVGRGVRQTCRAGESRPPRARRRRSIHRQHARARDRATRHRRRSPFVSGISFRDIEMQVLATGRVCMRYEMKSVPFCSTKSR